MLQPSDPNEAIAWQVCQELLTDQPGYQATFSFGTPGGNDLDLRLCFADLSAVDQDALKNKLGQELRSRGVSVDLDLLFMSSQEFASGIRDLIELGDVAEKLTDGFDPHHEQAAVGDTSMFSLYIFSTMRLLHRNETTGDFGSPGEALDRLALTRDGAVGWMHYYTGTFLHEYLGRRSTASNGSKYLERLAKFASRTTVGSTLARLELPQLANIKPELIKAIRSAGPWNSTDTTMAGVIVSNSHTVILLDADAKDLLDITGRIRSGEDVPPQPQLISLIEARLFYEAFQQGIDRRPELGDAPDPLTAYALGEFIRSLGSRQNFNASDTLIEQGTPGDNIFYIPLKNSSKQTNGSVSITVRNAEQNIVGNYIRPAGNAVGEGALFGLPRSATVTAREQLEAYVIPSKTVRNILSDPHIHQELQRPVLTTESARQVDILLRYLARQAGIFTRQTLPYTTLAARAEAQTALRDNPLHLYNLGQEFLETLQLYESSGIAHTITASQKPQVLFEAGATNKHLYVISKGQVQIGLQNGEPVTLQKGEFFGESSLIEQPTTGQATLTPGSSVLAIEAREFKRLTQSRNPLPGTDVLPIHLLYHLAAEGYDRIRRRLMTQQKS